MPSSASQHLVRTCQSRRRLASPAPVAGSRNPAPLAGYRNPAPVAGHRNPAPVAGVRRWHPALIGR